MENVSLTGKWSWINTSVLLKDEWQILETFAPSNHIWDFRENNVMESEYAGRPLYRVSYKWDERGMTLSLNGHKLDSDGNKYCLVYERYNVLFLNPDEIYLIDTEDYMDIPGSRLRLHFMRDKNNVCP